MLRLRYRASSRTGDAASSSPQATRWPPKRISASASAAASPDAAGGDGLPAQVVRLDRIALPFGHLRERAQREVQLTLVTHGTCTGTASSDSGRASADSDENRART